MRFRPLAIIVGAYDDVYENWRGLLRVGALWIIVTQGLKYATDWSGVGAEGWWGTLVSLADLAAWGAIAVAWHRHIILDAPLNGPVAPLNGRVVRFVLAWIVVSFVIGAAATAVALPIFISPADAGLLNILLIFGVLFLGGAALLARLTIWFPAIAVGDRSIGWRRSIELTRGHSISIAVCFFLAMLPIGLAALTMLYIVVSIGGVAMPLLASVVSFVATLASIAVGAAFLSLTYVSLVPPAAAGDTDAP